MIPRTKARTFWLVLVCVLTLGGCADAAFLGLDLFGADVTRALSPTPKIPKCPPEMPENETPVNCYRVGKHR